MGRGTWLFVAASIVALVLLCSTAFGCQIIYVDAEAPGANNGTTWSDAFHSLQDALAAAGAGDEIWAAQGSYRPDDGNGITSGDRTATFQLKTGVSLYGGFVTGGSLWEERDHKVYVTILSGDLNEDDADINDPCGLLYHPTRGENSYHVVMSNGVDASTIIDGFVISGGNADDPCGGVNASGAGMYNTFGSPAVSHCTFRKNASRLDGGGLFCEHGVIKLVDCIFNANYAYQGGGLLILSSWPGPVLINCLFNGNFAEYLGGAVCDINSDTKFTNCTVSANRADLTGGIISDPCGYVRLVNCILWANTDINGFEDTSQIFGGCPEVTYSCIQQWDEGGPGNIASAPKFVDPMGRDGIWGTADDNLRLAFDSDCIEQGDNTAVADVNGDLDGRSRLTDGDCYSIAVVDIGAYEFNWSSIGDMDNRCSVDFKDFAVLAGAWLTESTAAGYNSSCDIGVPADGMINWRDVDVLADNWLSVAQQPYQFKISIDPNTQADYGVSYPITYKFSFTSESSSLHVYKKYAYAEQWVELPQKTGSDFFNGIEAVRFDFLNKKAYVSVTFRHGSDKIYLRITDEQGLDVSSSYLTICDYYDERKAVVTASADDWYTASNPMFSFACDAFTSRHIWLTVGIITEWIQPEADTWVKIQSKVDAGYIEPASHTRTHPHTPYDYDSEIGGSKQDIIDNLDLPESMRSGDTEYVYTFIEPFGNTNPEVKATVGEYKYIVDRGNSFGQDGWGQYCPDYNIYRPYWTVRMGDDVWGPGGMDPDELNAAFDACYNTGNRDHLMFLPVHVDWSEESYAYPHLDHIKEKNDVWYVGLGFLYEYHYVKDQQKITVENFSY